MNEYRISKIKLRGSIMKIINDDDLLPGESVLILKEGADSWTLVKKSNSVAPFSGEKSPQRG